MKHLDSSMATLQPDYSMATLHESVPRPPLHLASTITINDPPPIPIPISEPVLPKQQSRGKDFWLSFIAIVVTILLSALDLTAISTILPTLTADLDGGDDFTWVGSAYALASTAVLPLIGGLADSFGRKPVMLGCIVLFAIGSALAGSAQNMNWMIGARTVQGLGGGGIQTLTNIITSDLVPLAERGTYQGLIGLTIALASGVGPPVGGALAQKASWRWLFYINLPLCAICFALVLFFLKVRTPPGSVKDKLSKIDWFGNVIIIAGTTLAIVGLTWGGTRYPWTDARVLAPLIVGVITMGAFVVYEIYIPEHPTIPFRAIANRTSASGFATASVHGVASISIIYYLPIYFQAVLGASPIRSGVDMLAAALVISPFALICGAVVKVTGKYRPVNYAGWIMMIVGFGLLSLLKADSDVGHWVGYQILVSAGSGMIFSATVFPVLAPLPVSLTAPALAFFAFVKSFAQTWGITISSTILQNQLKTNLPADFTSQFPAGAEIAYAAIPAIPQLPEPLRTEVKVAFASSMSTIWKTMIGFSGLGLLLLLLMKEVPMSATGDENFGLDSKKREVDVQLEALESRGSVFGARDKPFDGSRQ